MKEFLLKNWRNSNIVIWITIAIITVSAMMFQAKGSPKFWNYVTGTL